jgi:hypothetical protein
MPLFSAIMAASFGAQLTIASLLALFLGKLDWLVPDERAAQFGELTKIYTNSIISGTRNYIYFSSKKENRTDTNCFGIVPNLPCWRRMNVRKLAKRH